MALVNKEGKSKSPLIVQLAPLKRALPPRRGDWGGIMHIYDRSGFDLYIVLYVWHNYTMNFRNTKRG